ncbi:hypothetical protein FRC10_004950, partial [Ceratobasidium sp. 414]
LILVIVTSLSAGQFFIEFQEAKGSVGPTSSEMEGDPYTDPPSSLFPFTPAPRNPKPDASQYRPPTPNRANNSHEPELLSPTYRASPRRVVAFEIPENSDVGSGNGRDRARELMGVGK